MLRDVAMVRSQVLPLTKFRRRLFRLWAWQQPRSAPSVKRVWLFVRRAVFRQHRRYTLLNCELHVSIARLQGDPVAVFKQSTCELSQVWPLNAAASCLSLALACGTMCLKSFVRSVS